MHSITRRFNVAFGAILIATVAACSGGSPTASVMPSHARFDGGIGFGSGNFVGTGDNATTAADSGSAASGGIGFGSGN